MDDLTKRASYLVGFLRGCGHSIDLPEEEVNLERFTLLQQIVRSEIEHISRVSGLKVTCIEAVVPFETWDNSIPSDVLDVTRKFSRGRNEI